MNIQKALITLADDDYKRFQAPLIPSIDSNKMLGVRLPKLRKYARSIYNTTLADEFLNNLPHEYYDENNLHAFLIACEKDFDKAIIMVERFLPYVDNWATCDSLRPKVFALYKKELLPYVISWLDDEYTYTVRFALNMLLVHYLDDAFAPLQLEAVHKKAITTGDNYYINMAIAWYYSLALIKQYDSTLPYFTEKKLPIWIHNKALQKARESLKCSKEQKDYFNSLKIKSTT